MTCLIPRSPRGLLLAGGVACAVAVIGLSGCSSTTYGTGTDPGTQTLKDLAGIAMIGGNNNKPINYQPRADVVAPPPGAETLPPPPGSNNAAGPTVVASTDSDPNPPNWPHDPDVAAAKFKADIAAREARGEAPAPIKLPAQLLPHYDTTVANRTARSGPPSQTYTAEENAKIRTAFANAKGSLAVDAQGNPVRRYLIEPPVDLRQPDPTQPAVFTEKKKKFHWWWQKQDDADNLTPADTANTTGNSASNSQAPVSHD